MQYLTSILMIVAGVLLLFGGWTIYRKLIFLFGFIVGGIAGGMVAFAIMPAVVFVIFGVLVGAVIGVLLFKFVNIAVFIVIGGLAGFLFAKAVVPPMVALYLYYITLSFCAVLGAVVALIFKKISIVAATSFVGAFITISGIEQLTLQFGSGNIFGDGMTQISRITIIIVLAFIGAMVQLVSGKRKK
ncbi:hypothetical protein DRQ26_06125 [bacterium]|nr:MAG: hypothetical protein DRQ26_06125 [bacterium]